MSVNEVKRYNAIFSNAEEVDFEPNPIGKWVRANDYDAAIDGQRQMSRDIKFYRERCEGLQARAAQLERDVYFWKSRYNEKCQTVLEVNDLKRVMDDLNSSGKSKSDAS